MPIMVIIPVIGYLRITSKPKNSPPQLPTYKVFLKAKHTDIALSSIYGSRGLNTTVLWDTTAPKKIIYSGLWGGSDACCVREIPCLLISLRRVLAVV